MTPEELALVQASFAKAGDSLEELTSRFYEVLFGLDPEVRPLFTGDLTAQRAKLADTLTAIVAAMGRLGDLLAVTTPLGARHVEYGVQPHHYELVREALLTALEDVLGDEWDLNVAAAWAKGYDLVAETMMAAR